MSSAGVSLMWLLDGIAAVPANDARISDLTLDSRDVRSGSLFFALRGRQAHGIAFAAEAAARGATAVLWEPAPGVEAPALAPAVFSAPVVDLHKAVGRIADRFFNWPSSQLRVVGITGTNGKTTCAYLLAQCLVRLESDAAYIGTIGWGRIGALETPTHTTPDAISVHRTLARLRSLGVRDVAMEVSSHALDQGRVDGVHFHSAAFTNLSRDHLDYHVSMQAYGEAKARLLAIPDLEHIIVNIGDSFGRQFAQSYTGRAPLTAVWIGDGGAGWLADRSLHASEVAVDLRGVSMLLDGSFGRLQPRHEAPRPLQRRECGGGHRLLARARRTARATRWRRSRNARAPPGRMEVIEPAVHGKPLAVVDYAHTPDALAKALAALREHCRGALWCVFGCGGDRDPGKRPLMGAVADELADQIIVTDDNPRSENPQTIVRGITGGIKAHCRAGHPRSRSRRLPRRSAKPPPRTSC